MFDLQPKQKIAKKLPKWVEEGNEKVKALYQAIVNRVEEIEELILNNEPLTPSQYKISKSVISKTLGYSDSYINKHIGLNEFVDSEQRRLKRSINALNTADRSKKAAQNKVTQMRRDELINEVTVLRRTLKLRQSEIYASQLNHLIDSGLSEKQAITAQRIKHLERTVEDQRAKIAVLEANYKHITDDLIAQIEINEAQKKQLDFRDQTVKRVK